MDVCPSRIPDIEFTPFIAMRGHNRFSNEVERERG
jgi:hypothetical protein